MIEDGSGGSGDWGNNKQPADRSNRLATVAPGVRGTFSNPQSPLPGTFGASCQSSSECTSGPCVTGPTGAKFCSLLCYPGASQPCPGGETCHPTNITNLYVCGPPNPPATDAGPAPDTGGPAPDAGLADSGGAKADTTASTDTPVISLSEPSDGSTVGSSLTVKGQVTLTGTLADVMLFVDGAPSASQTQASFSFSLTLSAGSHQLRVVAKDTLGRSGEVSISVTVSDQANGTPASKGEKASYGFACQGPADCASNLCVQDATLNLLYCSQVCDPLASNCPQGSDCISGGSQHLCAPTPGQQLSNGTHTTGAGTLGCRVENGRSISWWLLALLGLALARRSPRRRIRG